MELREKEIEFREDIIRAVRGGDFKKESPKTSFLVIFGNFRRRNDGQKIVVRSNSEYFFWMDVYEGVLQKMGIDFSWDDLDPGKEPELRGAWKNEIFHRVRGCD